MCDPITGIAIASFAINAGSTIAGHVSQSKARAENKEAALRAMHETWTDINLIQAEQVETTARSIYEGERQARRVQSLAALSAGEAGVVGISVDELQGDIERQGAEFKVAEARNLDRTMAQLQREKISGRNIAQQRIAAVPPANPFATALRIGGAGIDAANFYAANQPPPTA